MKGTHLPSIHCISKEFVCVDKILHRIIDIPETTIKLNSAVRLLETKRNENLEFN